MEIEERPVEFIRREYSRLIGYVRSLLMDSPSEDAEDLVQEAISALFQRLHITGPVEDLASYVYGSLKNRVIDAYRRRGRDRTGPFPESISSKERDDFAHKRPEDEYPSGLKIDPVVQFESREIGLRIEEELEKLPPPLQIAFRLVELEGLTHREMAEELGVPLGTALSWKHRAVEILRKQLRDLDPGEDTAT